MPAVVSPIHVVIYIELDIWTSLECQTPDKDVNRLAIQYLGSEQQNRQAFQSPTKVARNVTGRLTHRMAQKENGELRPVAVVSIFL